MGLFIIVLLSIATVLLIRNMNKRLRRLPDSFDNVDASKRDAGKVDSTSREPGDDDVETAPSVDNDRSDSTTVETEPQVSGVDGQDRPTAEGGNAK
ncbi:hypothetical protein [Actinoplanes sp. NPDC049265]|uniref:hypothetical protein n=1 Tax=Actinoplanes sp. NPDC049265 TaxID=3363902 RepID=UPI003713C925